MPDFPDGIYAPRLKENLASDPYDPTQTKKLYADDIIKLDSEVVAIENYLGAQYQDFATTSGVVDCDMIYRTYKITPTGAMTINAIGGYRGAQVVFLFTSSGVTSRVVTFGGNFISRGNLATGTADNKHFTVTFQCTDGTEWVEICRTAVMN